MKSSRVLAVPAVALAAGLGSAVIATPAQAAQLAQACTRPTVAYHACLTVESTSVFNEYKITAGLDSFMSQQYAGEVVAGGAFTANLYADDPGGSDRLIASIPLAWVGAGAEGLGQEHAIWMSCRYLNEDTDGKDELYAHISWFDPHNGQWTTRQTGIVSYEFACR
ncbi:hypothetical protein Ait01nite_011630 [Actinoplanes italicus]|uniref:Uncharacterized protein n=1 Tax=Actinoplanes italicus TaxID=113567 RepID=A0A2T0KGQ8_9ACTN|nr:hypothetical protein [Actinoplanes italicus]PRX22598.1 hypothetical protein CLV67_104125 [Actinoplanes italicus]GIE28118.1 hypothetical protein Ait01nite_011630 [Actinoplanes italicus]